MHHKWEYLPSIINKFLKMFPTYGARSKVSELMLWNQQYKTYIDDGLIHFEVCHFCMDVLFHWWYNLSYSILGISRCCSAPLCLIVTISSNELPLKAFLIWRRRKNLLWTMMSTAVASLVEFGVWLKTAAHIGLIVPMSGHDEFSMHQTPIFSLWQTASG